MKINFTIVSGAGALDNNSKPTFTTATNNNGEAQATYTAVQADVTGQNVKVKVSGQYLEPAELMFYSGIVIDIVEPTTTDFYIDKTPKMPSITFKADVISPSGFNDMENVTLKWKLKINYTQHGRNDEEPVPEDGSEITMPLGNQFWTPNWGTILMGGGTTSLLRHYFVGLPLSPLLN
jgi:hypothetical protein